MATSPTRSPPLAFPVDVADSGDNEVIPAAPEGFAWHVLGWKLTSEDAVVVGVKIGDKTVSTLYSTAVSAGGEVCAPSADWGFPLLHEQAVSLNLDDAVGVGGHISAELVPFPNANRPVLLYGGEQMTFDFANLIYE